MYMKKVSLESFLLQAALKLCKKSGIEHKIIYGEDSELLPSVSFAFLTSLREKRLEFQEVKTKIK